MGSILKRHDERKTMVKFIVVYANYFNQNGSLSKLDDW